MTNHGFRVWISFRFLSRILPNLWSRLQIYQGSFIGIGSGDVCEHPIQISSIWLRFAHLVGYSTFLWKKILIYFLVGRLTQELVKPQVIWSDWKLHRKKKLNFIFGVNFFIRNTDAKGHIAVSYKRTLKENLHNQLASCDLQNPEAISYGIAWEAPMQQAVGVQAYLN